MVIGSDASSSKQALTMDGRAATSNLLNVTSFEKALLCQSLRALPDYPVRACLRTREKPTSHNALHATISAQAMQRDGFALAPHPETIWLAPSTFTLRQVRELCQLQDENTHRKQLVIDLALICHILLVVIRKKFEDSSSCRCQPVPAKRKFAKRNRSQPIQSELISLDSFNATKPRKALYELFANGDPTVTKMIKFQKQQSPIVSEPG